MGHNDLLNLTEYGKKYYEGATYRGEAVCKNCGFYTSTHICCVVEIAKGITQSEYLVNAICPQCGCKTMKPECKY